MDAVRPPKPSVARASIMPEQFPTSLALLQPGAVLRSFIWCPLLSKSYTRGDVPTGYRYEPLRFVESRPSSVPSLPLGASPRGGPRRRSNLTGVMAVAHLTSPITAASSMAATPQTARPMIPRPPLKDAAVASSRPTPKPSERATKTRSTTPRAKRSIKSNK